MLLQVGCVFPRNPGAAFLTPSLVVLHVKYKILPYVLSPLSPRRWHAVFSRCSAFPGQSQTQTRCWRTFLTTSLIGSLPNSSRLFLTKCVPIGSRLWQTFSSRFYSLTNMSIHLVIVLVVVNHFLFSYRLVLVWKKRSLTMTMTKNFRQQN